MRATISADGFTEIRGASADKPALGTEVSAYDPRLRGTFTVPVRIGDIYIETDTGNVYIMDTDWTQL